MAHNLLYNHAISYYVLLYYILFSCSMLYGTMSWYSLETLCSTSSQIVSDVFCYLALSYIIYAMLSLTALSLDVIWLRLGFTGLAAEGCSGESGHGASFGGPQCINRTPREIKQRLPDSRKTNVGGLSY